MFKIPYEQIIAKIQSQTSLDEQAIQTKINEKLSQLSGLISKEGAAHIIANELGVKLYEQTEGPLKIKNILNGMRQVETIGKVIQKSNIIEFNKNDRQGKVCSLQIADETGEIRLVLWNDQTNKLQHINTNDTIKIKNAYTRNNNNNQLEIHLGDRGTLEMSDVIVKVDSVPDNQAQQSSQPQQSQRKWLHEIKENDFNIEVLATIVQVFAPTFYEVCPECNKRARPKDGQIMCEQHGQVIPNYNFVINAVLDDGSESVRAVFFRQQAEQLTKKSSEQILEIKTAPLIFEELKKELLGTQVKIKGRIIKNSVYNRLEIISQNITSDINAEQELQELNKLSPNKQLTPEELSQKIVNNEI